MVNVPGTVTFDADSKKNLKTAHLQFMLRTYVTLDTECRGWVYSKSAAYSGDAGSNSARRTATLTVRLCYSQPLQGSTSVIPELRPRTCTSREETIERNFIVALRLFVAQEKYSFRPV
jgi:hypothetical protein